MKGMGIIYFLWPPAETYAANKVIQERRKKLGTDVLWKNIQDSVDRALSEIKEVDPLAQLAEKYFESENKRREIIEGKAAAIVQLVGFAASVLAIGGTLFVRDLKLSGPFSFVVVTLFLLCVLHLLISVFYAFRVRLLRPLVLPTAEGFVDLVIESKDVECKRLIIRQRISEMKWNEDALMLKNNDLVAAERLFQRGLAFLACATLFLVVAKSFFG